MLTKLIGEGVCAKLASSAARFTTAREKNINRGLRVDEKCFNIHTATRAL